MSRIAHEAEQRRVKLLEAVAEAAKNEALFWNESYCNHAEYCIQREAMRALQAALAELAALEAE